MVSPVCLFFVSTVKNALGYDDALDVFGVHCIGGIIGALGTGILVNPALGGVGITDYTNITGNNAGTYDFVTQMIAQGKAVLATLLWSGIGSAILYKIVDVIVGLRPTVEDGTRRSRHHRSRRARLQHVSSPGARLSGSRPELRFGHIPGNAPTVEGLQRKLGPLLLAADHGHSRRGTAGNCPLPPMVNRVLTSPYLWWFDPLPAGLDTRPAAPRVLALQVWQ